METQIHKFNFSPTIDDVLTKKNMNKPGDKVVAN